MVHKFTLAALLLAAFAFISCNNAPVAEQASKCDDMARCAKDSSFRKAHEKPENIAFQGRGEMTEFPTPDGGTGKAYLLKPVTPSGKYLFMMHEWWGLNDQIKREAERLADSLGNVTVMALDLYDGRVTGDADKAGELMNAVNPERCNAIIKGALDVAGPDARIATVGWCFGGGWSLRSSIFAAGRGAGCVMYYGLPVEKANELAPLQADVLGLFAKQDNWINEKVVGKFDALAKATGKNLETHWYDAAHAFANPSSARYNQQAAQEANKLALACLRKHLAD